MNDGRVNDAIITGRCGGVSAMGDLLDGVIEAWPAMVPA